VNDLQQQHRGQDSVAGRGVMQIDDVATLLASERVAPFFHCSEHGAIADISHDNSDTVSLHRAVKSEVGHTRDNDRVESESSTRLKIERHQRDETIAIYHAAGFVDGDDAIAVTVEGNADLSDFRAQPR
jgi:hypothetical protein